MINKFFGVQKSGVALDTDAQAFITAAGITDGTQQTAINTLVVGLKADSLWTKMKAIYPFVGGTADTHKYNLKDPRDLDAAYRWTYVGSNPLTHSSNGIKANGVSTCNTHLKTTDLGLNSFTGTVYARNLNITTNNSDFGDLPDTSTFYLCIRYSGLSNATISNINQSGVNNFDVTNPGDVGLWSSSRIANNDLRVYRNGVQKSGTKTTATTSSSGGDIVFAGSSTSPCIKEYAFMSFGDGLNTTENANLYTLVQAFQTTLSRQV